MPAATQFTMKLKEAVWYSINIIPATIILPQPSACCAGSQHDLLILCRENYGRQEQEYMNVSATALGLVMKLTFQCKQLFLKQ